MLPTKTSTGLKLLARLWPLITIQLLTGAGFSLSLPFLSLYLYQDRGVPMGAVGAIMLSSAVVGALARVAGGELSDRVGRRPVLLGALSLRILLFLGLSAGVHYNLWVMLIALLYLGVRFSGAFAMPAATAMVADLSSEEERMRAYGILRVGANLGWALGPSVGGFLKIFLPYQALFLLTAAVSGLCTIVALFFLRESLGSKREDRAGPAQVFSSLGDPQFRKFIFLSLLVLLVAGQLISTLSVFVVDRLGLSTAHFGTMLTLNGLLVVALQYPLTRILERRRRNAVLALGAFLYGLGYFSMGWLYAFWALMAAVGIATLGEIVFVPASLAVVAKLASPAERGRYMGLWGLAESFGWSAGPLIGGVLLDLFPHDPRPLWGIIASLAFVASLGFLCWELRGGGIDRAPFLKR